MTSEGCNKNSSCAGSLSYSESVNLKGGLAASPEVNRYLVG